MKLTSPFTYFLFCKQEMFPPLLVPFLSLPAVWLTGMVVLSWQPDPTAWGQRSAVGSRKRTAHTGHYGNTPLRGPRLTEQIWSGALYLHTVFSALTLPGLISVCVCVSVGLPVCEWESSPGPGRQSCPLHCGTWLWSLRRWRCCLGWASTGDTSPENTDGGFCSYRHVTQIRPRHLVLRACRSQRCRWGFICCYVMLASLFHEFVPRKLNEWRDAGKEKAAVSK